MTNPQPARTAVDASTSLLQRLNPFREIALLFAVFYLVYLLNSGSLRLVWMDWCNLNEFRNMSGWPGFLRLLTNEWQASPRVQFLSWMTQALTEKWFGYWAAPYFAISLGAHFLSALLVHRMMRQIVSSADTARAAAVLYLVFPTSAGALFVINNAFFVLSFSAAVMLAYLLMFPRKRAWADHAALTAAALACQFLGEQTLPLLYLILAWFGLREVKNDGWRRGLLRAGIPLAACALSLAAYYPFAVKPYSHSYPLRWSFSVAYDFAKNFFVSHLQAMNFSSWMYGNLSVPPSPETVFLAPLLVLVLWFVFFGRPQEPDAAPEEDLRLPTLFLATGLASTAVPVLYTALTGYRTAVETRYMYCSGLILAVMLPLFVESAGRQWSGKTYPMARKCIFLLAASYFAVLTIYDLRDIWGAQKRLDERVWAQVDAGFNPQVKFVATDGLQWATLLPLTRSNAVSHGERGGAAAGDSALRRPDGAPRRAPRRERRERRRLDPFGVQAARLFPAPPAARGHARDAAREGLGHGARPVDAHGRQARRVAAPQAPPLRGPCGDRYPRGLPLPPLRSDISIKIG